MTIADIYDGLGRRTTALTNAPFRTNERSPFSSWRSKTTTLTASSSGCLSRAMFTNAFPSAWSTWVEGSAPAPQSRRRTERHVEGRGGEESPFKPRDLLRTRAPWWVAAAAWCWIGCADDPVQDFPPGEWVALPVPGAVCGDGSPYRIYVNRQATSDDVVVFFEPGGACWDHETCSNDRTHFVADDYATRFASLGGLTFSVDQVFPLLNDDPDVSPVADWTKVFFPYCTDDVYAGDVEAVYDDPGASGPSIAVQHRGRPNLVAATRLLSQAFPNVSDLLVTGCSAGATGAALNYATLRELLAPAAELLIGRFWPRDSRGEQPWRFVV